MLLTENKTFRYLFHTKDKKFRQNALKTLILQPRRLLLSRFKHLYKFSQFITNFKRFPVKLRTDSKRGFWNEAVKRFPQLFYCFSGTLFDYILSKKSYFSKSFFEIVEKKFLFQMSLLSFSRVEFSARNRDFKFLLTLHKGRRVQWLRNHSASPKLAWTDYSNVFESLNGKD